MFTVSDKFELSFLGLILNKIHAGKWSIQQNPLLGR